MSLPPRRHTLADHVLGAFADHVHEGDEDHDHDEDPRHDLLEPGSRALESAPFVSIGIDVGSAGTQIAFSRLTMRGPGEPSSLRRLAKSRQTLFMSEPALTPWAGGEIDIEALRDLVDAAFSASGVSPDDVETGAVILTGDAAASATARRIVDALAEDVGELVSAVAGHHMEAMLAAWGSGAMRRSLETRGRVLLADMGGGTVKFALIEDGRVARVAALRVGSRLAVFDADGRVARLAPEGAAFARRAGFSWTIGGRATKAEIEAVAAAMAETVIAALREPADARIAGLWLTEPLPVLSTPLGLMLSGGVAEYVYEREARDFGDLGLAFGGALRARLAEGALSWPLLAAGECIRATVLGAAEHSVQISGETCFISSPAALLPRRNLQVLAPDYSFRGAVEADALAAAIAERRLLFDLTGTERDFALALRWRGEPDHARLLGCAQGVAAGLADLIAAQRPLFLLMEGDAALNLASILRDELDARSEILALDGLVLRDFDWVDIGRLRLPSNTVPVTVKTLLFHSDQKQRRTTEP
jgi:ethanolamine utilization protein EutA